MIRVKAQSALAVAGINTQSARANTRRHCAKPPAQGATERVVTRKPWDPFS